MKISFEDLYAILEDRMKNNKVRIKNGFSCPEEAMYAMKALQAVLDSIKSQAEERLEGIKKQREKNLKR